MKKTVKAWAVITDKGKLVDWGLFPRGPFKIFATKKEAQSQVMAGRRTIKCTITYEIPTPKEKSYD